MLFETMMDLEKKKVFLKFKSLVLCSFALLNLNVFGLCIRVLLFRNINNLSSDHLGQRI